MADKVKFQRVWILYETVNLINGKLYRGQHECRSLNTFDPWYIGRGKALQKAFIKYGKKNFKRRIMCFAYSQISANILERFFVDEIWVARKDTYNIIIGGENPRGYKHTEEDKARMSIIQKGKVTPLETRQRQSEAQRGEKNHFYGKHHSQETCEILRQKNSGENHVLFGTKRTAEQIEVSRIAMRGNTWNVGRKQSPEWVAKKNAALTGQKRTPEMRKNISDSKKGMYSGNKNSRYNHKVTIKMVQDCMDEGMTIGETAEYLECSRKVVINRRKGIGI